MVWIYSYDFTDQAEELRMTAGRVEGWNLETIGLIDLNVFIILRELILFWLMSWIPIELRIQGRSSL